MGKKEAVIETQIHTHTHTHRLTMCVRTRDSGPGRSQLCPPLDVGLLASRNYEKINVPYSVLLWQPS